MYCVIIKEPMTHKPYPARIYKDPVWRPIRPGSENCELTGKEIERGLQHKWKILIRDVHRDAEGVVKKRQWHIHTVTYWDIVDEFLDFWTYEEGIGYAIEKYFPDAQDYCWQLVQEKFDPIKRAVIEEYKKSEEYRWFRINQRMKEKGDPHEATRREQPWQQSDDSCYQSWQNPYNDSRGDEDADDCELPAMAPSLTEEQKDMAYRLIGEGYRRMAFACHPDAGGKHDDMIMLNAVKEILHKLISY